MILDDSGWKQLTKTHQQLREFTVGSDSTLEMLSNHVATLVSPFGKNECEFHWWISVVNGLYILKVHAMKE